MKCFTINSGAVFAGLIMTVTGFPVQTFAQTVLEEIVVTARQREEKLTDVPASITAFTASTIERANIERAEDFIALTPGVSLVDTAEVGDAQVSIRGINGSRDAEANFAFIVDGILHTNPSAFNREFADLQQIEILKGPQGAIYGRSASAGAIIVTTKKPTDEFEAAIKGSAGNDNSYFVSAHASGGLAENLAGRIHVDYRTTDGFYNNSFLDKDDIVDDFEDYNINGRLLWEPNEDLSVDFRAHYGEVDAASITFNAAFALADAAAFLGVGELHEDVNEHDFVFQTNRDPSNDQESKDFSIKVDYDMDRATLTGWFLYSDIDQKFLADGTSGAFGFFATQPNCGQSVTDLSAAGVTLPAPTFLGTNPFAANFDPTNLFFNPTGSFLGPYTPTLCDGYQYQERNQEDFSFELRLTSASDQRLRWQGGVYYLNLEREVGVATLVDDGRADLIQSFVNPLTEALVHDQFDTEVFAVFGQLAYDVTNDLEISAALRYDNEKREVRSLVPAPVPGTRTNYSNFIDYTTGFLVFPAGGAGCEDSFAGSPLNPAFVDFTTCTINSSIPNRKETFEEVQPKISVRWNANENWTFFGSWGVGFKSGGFNNQGSEATVNLFFNTPAPAIPNVSVGYPGAGLSITDQFDKETSNAFEVGFKSQWASGRVNFEGAIYHTLVDDMQIFNFFVGAFGLLRVVSNIDEVSITGFESALSVQVTDALKIYAGGAVTNARIDANSNRPQTVGNRVPYAPEYTFNFGGEYVKPTGFLDGVDFVSRVDYTAVGPTWFATVQEGDRTPNLFTPFAFGFADQSRSQRNSYGLVNIRVGLQSDTWGLHGVVKNLMDEKYLGEVIPAPEFGGSFIHPGNERAWAVEVSYRF
jgi:iron complex outermembrane recepter protein